MKNSTLSMIGKILFCIPFLVFGIMHLTNANAMAGMVPAYLPSGVFWIYLTGIVQILFVASLIFTKQAKLASSLLAVMMVLFVLMLHVPGLSNPDMAQSSMSMMLKDIGLAGGALLLASKYDN